VTALHMSTSQNTPCLLACRLSSTFQPSRLLGADTVYWIHIRWLFTQQKVCPAANTGDACSTVLHLQRPTHLLLPATVFLLDRHINVEPLH
jgi:hypothetical protein